MKQQQQQQYCCCCLLVFLIILQPGTPDPDDQECLTQLYAGWTNNPTLKNWTKPNLSQPCYNGFESYLSGITCNNGRIFRLSLPNMNLGGTISPSLTKCTGLQTLDLSSNTLSGQIPTSINSLTNLAILYLSNNRLTGQIPPQLTECPYLNVIDLHNNRLVGPLPQQLGILTRLNTLDVSYNRLSGMIPASLGGNRSGTGLPRFNASSFQGNSDLYGYPLEPYRKNRGLSLTAIVGIGLGSGLLSLIISFSIVCVWLKVNEHRQAAAQEAKISHLMPDY